MSHVSRPVEEGPPDDDFGPLEYDGPPESGPAPTPEQRRPGVIESRWLCLADAPDWLIEEPPKQAWLLTQFRDRRDHGIFPRGRTGLLNATGGVGKTYALIQLAVAVASGGFWFDLFRAVEAGHVCLALAEEEADEARRRLYKAANALELSADERREIAQRIHVLPLAGLSVALTSSPAPGQIVPTAVARELRAQLESRELDWSLIIIDPLSRWAGGGVEGDNEAATRFCQVVESLTSVRGNPSILVAHHSSKTSAKDGSSDARGVTGIRDGFRWQATMDPVVSDDGTRGVILRNRKSNYSLEFADVVLVRNQEPGTEGTLRPATEQEAQRLLGTAKPESADDIKDRVLSTVARLSGLTSANEIQKVVPGKRQAVLVAIRELIFEGRLQKSARGFEVVPKKEDGTK